MICGLCKDDTAHVPQGDPETQRVWWVCGTCQTRNRTLTGRELEAEVAARIKPLAEHPVPSALPRVFIESSLSDETGIEILEEAVAAHYKATGAAPVPGEPLQRRPAGELYAIPYGRVLRVVH